MSWVNGNIKEQNFIFSKPGENVFVITVRSLIFWYPIVGVLKWSITNTLGHASKCETQTKLGGPLLL